MTGGQQVTAGGLKVQGQTVCGLILKPTHSPLDLTPVPQKHVEMPETKSVYIWIFMFAQICPEHSDFDALKRMFYCVCMLQSQSFHIIQVTRLVLQMMEAEPGEKVTEKQRFTATSIRHHPIQNNHS